MSPVSSNPRRLLLFGTDGRLLETRAMILQSAGMIADIAVNIKDFRLRTADAGSLYVG